MGETKVLIPLAAPQQQGNHTDNEVSLFPDIAKDPNKTIATISVRRLSPVEEYLGTIDRSADEEDIRKRWGGGVYQLVCKNAAGRNVTGGQRTVTIAGEARDDEGRRSNDVSTIVKAHQLAAKIETDAWRQRAETEARLAEEERRKRAEERKAELEVLRAENELRIKQEDAKHARELERIKAESENRLREERARQEQQLQLERERTAQNAASNDKILQIILSSQKEFKEVLLNLTHTKADPVAQFQSGMQMAMQLADAKNPDPSLEMTKMVTGGIENMTKAIMGGPAAGAKPAASAPGAPAASTSGSVIDQAIQQIPKQTRNFLAKALKLKNQIEATGENAETLLEDIEAGRMQLIDAEDAEEFRRYLAWKEQRQQAQQQQAQRPQPPPQQQLPIEQKPGRDENGRWVKGITNPKQGRPRGVSTRRPHQSQPTTNPVVEDHQRIHGTPGAKRTARKTDSSVRHTTAPPGPDRTSNAAVDTTKHQVSEGEPGNVPEPHPNASVASG